MTTAREMYARIDAEWPATTPPMTDWEAVRAASRLWRWARGEACPYPIVATSGNRRTRTLRGTLYVNPASTDHHGGGWKSFIHELSHVLDLERKAHSKHHAQLELRMVREVLKRGWLDGRLKREQKPMGPETRAEKLQAARVIELQRIEAGIERWEAKARRAETALAKLRKRQRYYASVTA